MGWWFTGSKSRKAKGGIKVYTRRSDFEKSWWVNRWKKILDGYVLGQRMSQGRTCLSNGQVISIDIQKGGATACVQGSASSPYNVTILVQQLSKSQWKRVIPALFEQHTTGAKILTGQIPKDIEKIFLKAKVPLFPSSGSDFKTGCDCDDWANPCKHILAVYLLVGKTIDLEPLILFKLRGAEYKDILKMAGLYDVGMEEIQADEEKASETPKPIPVEPSSFWRYDSGNRDSVELHTPKVHAALPKWLGNLPLGRSKKKFISSLEEMYRDASNGEFDVFVENRRYREEQDIF